MANEMRDAIREWLLGDREQNLAEWSVALPKRLERLLRRVEDITVRSPSFTSPEDRILQALKDEKNG